MENFRRIIIAAYRLPFKLVRKKEEYFPVQNSGGLVSAILSLSEKLNPGRINEGKIIWVGTGEKQLETEIKVPGFELHSVDIPRKTNEKYYGGFCNNTIWPLFHYFPSRTVFDESYFEAYRNANDLFFQKLKDLVKPGDMIWIHDYQLFLLPQMMRNRFPDASIGFFLHIPFPSFEIFRLMPRKWRETVLAGMTGSDLVGFHTFDYTQHFIKSVKRTLGYKVDGNYIHINERICKADAFPIGIDYNKFHCSALSARTVTYIDKLKSYLTGHKLVFSVDRLDYSKGLLNRLAAFERFLEKYPEWHFKVVFNMVVVPSRDNIGYYREIKKEIEATVGRINGKYSTLRWRPIIYQYSSLGFNELVAVYSLSDAGLITPLRDGMNLVAKEYVACQNESHLGMLILSDMAGASVELNEAVLINPNDIDETSDAINIALTMPEDEKLKRIMKMQQRIMRYDVFFWATDFFDQLTDVKNVQTNMQVNYLDRKTLHFILEKFKNAEKRLMLIDYDGTLTPLASLPEMAVLNEKTRVILEQICEDSRNNVAVISGRNREFLENQFNNMNITLVAEHGYFTRYPGSDWLVNHAIDLSWKKYLLPVLNNYVDRCSGSMIEEKYASLVWHYRNAEEEIASLRINELKDDLSELLKNESKLFVLEGDKVLEIKSIVYDKGTVVSGLVSREEYDFIFAIGDDSTDEDLFRALPVTAFTIKVGRKPSSARFNVPNQSQVPEILKLFTG